MSNESSCENHDRRMFKGFCDPVIDAEEIGPLTQCAKAHDGWAVHREDEHRQRDAQPGECFTLPGVPGKTSVRSTVPESDTGEQVEQTKALRESF